MQDFVFQVDRLPHIGETLQSHSLQTFHGGKGSNQALSAYKYGSDVTFFTSLGEDPSGLSARQYYESLGLNVKLIQQGKTGMAVIMRTFSDNAIVIAPNIPPAINFFQGFEQDFKKSDIFMIQLEIGEKLAFDAISRAKKLYVDVLLDPTPIQTPLSTEWYSLLDWITPNQQEAELLLGYSIDTLDKAKQGTQDLINYGCSHVLLTLGSQGVVYQDKQYRIVMPAHKFTVKDTTGAGDIFNGSFISRYLYNKNKTDKLYCIKDALYFATSAAGLSITQYGASSSIPEFSQVQAYCNKEPIKLDLEIL